MNALCHNLKDSASCNFVFPSLFRIVWTMTADLPEFQEQEAAQILLLVHADGLMTVTDSEDPLLIHVVLDEDEIERDRQQTVQPRLTSRWRVSKAKRKRQRRESNDKKPDFLRSSRASHQLLDSSATDESALGDSVFRTRNLSNADTRPCSNPDRVCRRRFVMQI